MNIPRLCKNARSSCIQPSHSPVLNKSSEYRIALHCESITISREYMKHMIKSSLTEEIRPVSHCVPNCRQIMTGIKMAKQGSPSRLILHLFPDNFKRGTAIFRLEMLL